MTTIADRETQAKSEYRVIGTRPIRHDGPDKVTGRAKYGADVNMPGLLYGKVLRSPHAHARILSIDTSKAQALPGVRAAVTAQDLPILEDGVIDFGETVGNPRMLAENCLARNKALYRGHALAAVAATNPNIAEEALGLIDVEYEVLPVALTAEDAMREGAPLLHEDMTMRSLAERFTKGSDTGVRSNVASHLQFSRGNLEAGFAEAAHIVEHEFRTKTVHQGYIEPHTCTALWSAGDHVTVWTSTQGAFGIREQTAQMLGLSQSTIKVIPMEIGGGFGGKISVYMEPLAALLSKKSGSPVKMTMSRKEVLEATGPTSGTLIRARIGADATGRITAAELYMAYEAGAFPGSPVGAGASTALAPYSVDNLLIDAYDVVCNKPKVAAYRAPGSPQAAYAVESVIDELAKRLGMDPLDFRLKNAAQEGDRLASGVRLPRIGCIEVLQAMKAHPHYNTPLEGEYRGRGVAIGYWFNAGLQSSATVSVNPDGTVGVVTGSVDIGGTRAAVAMQVAEALGLRAEDVLPSVADTDSIGWTGVTGGSRTAFSTGIAAITAAEGVKRQLIERAALIWETGPEDVDFRDGVFFSKTIPEKSMSFRQVAARMLSTGGPITVSATSNPKQVGPAVGGNIVDVEVDPETGKVSILRYTAFQDAGKAAHPSYVEGQLQGGTAQGIGWALNEEYYYNPDGTLMNSTLLDYRMPTSLDLPMIDAVIVEVPNPGHPFGLRGVGEISIVPPLGAIANAVYWATGCRMTKLPMNPAAILEALMTEAPGESQ